MSNKVQWNKERIIRERGHGVYTLLVNNYGTDLEFREQNERDFLIYSVKAKYVFRCCPRFVIPLIFRNLSIYI